MKQDQYPSKHTLKVEIVIEPRSGGEESYIISVKDPPRYLPSTYLDGSITLTHAEKVKSVLSTLRKFARSQKSDRSLTITNKTNRNRPGLLGDPQDIARIFL